MAIICEDRTRADEHVIFDSNAVPDHDVVLNSYSISDCGSSLNESLSRDVAVAADDRTFHNVGERPYARSAPDIVRLTQRVCMNKRGRLGGR
jgi:hypothetical protein